MRLSKALPVRLLKSAVGFSLAAGLSAGAVAIGIEDVVDGGNNYPLQRRARLAGRG